MTHLQQDDFHVFDNDKPQVITHFSRETSRAGATSSTPEASGSLSATGAQSAPASTLPRRFMALFFDDIHMEFADMVRTREAADHYVAANMQPGDRMAIFTSSRQNQVDFTDDRAKLRDGFLSLRPRPMSEAASAQCPQILPYQAYRIQEKDDIAIQVAVQDAIYECCDGPSHGCPQADLNNIDRQARHLVIGLETESRYVLSGLERVCRRMAVLPGQRGILMVSPGFMIHSQTYELGRVIDQALRQNVVINTLDARGLYVNIMGGEPGTSSSLPADAK